MIYYLIYNLHFLHRLGSACDRTMSSEKKGLKAVNVIYIVEQGNSKGAKRARVGIFG